MGHKTHPIGFRLGVNRDWDAKWFAGKASDFRRLIQEDIRIRQKIASYYKDAGVAKVEIERGSGDLSVSIHTARPGIVIGRQGQRVEEVRTALTALTGKRIRLTIQEIKQPELSAPIVARNVADQLERRIAFRRAMRQTATRTMQSGAEGIKIICSGRLGGADIARSEKVMMGRVPLHTLRADIDYAIEEAGTAMGRIGVKVWIYKGEILPERKLPNTGDSEAETGVDNDDTAEELATNAATQES